MTNQDISMLMIIGLLKKKIIIGLIFSISTLIFITKKYFELFWGKHFSNKKDWKIMNR